MTTERLEQRTLFSTGVIVSTDFNNVFVTARPDTSALIIPNGFPRVFTSVRGFAIDFGLNANAAIRLSNGTLKITGTNFGDSIKVNEVLDNNGNDVFSININGLIRTVDASNVNRIVVSARGGGDVVDIADGLSVPVRVLGGSGNDLIFGNTENDFLLGGTGNDIILGNGGTDIIRGQIGNDFTTFTLNPAITPPLFNLNSMILTDFNSGLRFFSGPLSFGAANFSNQFITPSQLTINPISPL